MIKKKSVLTGSLAKADPLKRAKVVPIKVKTMASVAKEQEAIKLKKKKPAGKKK